MTTTQTTVSEARETYRACRRDVTKATGCGAKAFDRRAEALAREFADGERVEPRHWYMAATQLRWDVEQRDAWTLEVLGRAPEEERER
jgi:hypothetical protein